MWIVLDVMVIAVILVFAIMSAKRGFVKTAIEVVGFGLALYISFSFSGMIANKIYEGSIRPAMVSSLVSEAEQSVNAASGSAVDAVWEAMPKSLVKVAENFGVNKQQIEGEVTASSVSGIEQTVIMTVDSVLMPVIIPLIQTLISTVLFIVLMFLVKFLAKVIGRAARLPVIGKVNSLLGAMLGVAKGVVICFLACSIISVIVDLTGNGFLFFTNENIEKTSLFKLFSGLFAFKF